MEKLATSAFCNKVPHQNLRKFRESRKRKKGDVKDRTDLEEAAHEKIEREVEAGQEEVRDLRGTVEVIARNSRSRTRTRERVRGRRDVGREMEAEESEEAKNEGEEDDEFPA